MNYLDHFSIGITVICVGLIVLLIIAGVFVFMSPVWDCDTYRGQGYDTKVIWNWAVGNQCWIKEGSNFVPLEKWLTIKSVADVRGVN